MNIYSLTKPVNISSTAAPLFMNIYIFLCLWSLNPLISCCFDLANKYHIYNKFYIFIIFKDRTVLLEYNEMKKYFLPISLREVKTKIVKELFNISVDQHSMVLFQRLTMTGGSS